ncbi:hypothetical protein ABIF83_004743 [Bradyrhizobium ottawaense]
MLMIWSSLARNRSPDPVVLCLFGRIAISDATTEWRFDGIPKMNLQGSDARSIKTLQSQNVHNDECDSASVV